MPETTSHSSFLTRLSPATRESILSLAQAYHFKVGDTIFREGDPATMLYIVNTGRVAIEVHIPSKGRQTIMSAGPGELFSWSALVEPQIETASARATEETEVYGMKSGALMDLFNERCRVGFEVYHALSVVITMRLVATRLQLLDMYGTSAP
jgi:CRP/FNR family transcriptional regulator, cyclic AMP receptor protein